MRLRTDDRAVTVQIGTVLLFAVLIVLLSTYQATVVPQQNERMEFNHNQQVQGQLQDLRDELLRAGATGSGGSASVALGTQYPVRAFFVNPAPPSGTLRTTNSANVTIENAVASGEVRDYWNGDPQNFSTRGLVYEPNYHEYQRPPTTVYRNGVLYNRFDGANITLAGQRLIQGDTISLVAVDGSLSESSSGTASMDMRPVSTTTRTVTVHANAPLVITIPATLPKESATGMWQGLLKDEERFQSVTPGDDGNTVQIELKPGTYRLKLAKVGVGSDATDVSPHYVTDVRGDDESVAEGSSQQLVVEVRDRYNNPVSGARVNATLASNSVADAIAAQGQSPGENLIDLQTDDEGQVAIRYDAPADFGGENEAVTVNVSIEDVPDGPTFEPGKPENLSFNLTAVNADGSGLGGGDGGGDDGAYVVNWTDATGGGLDCDAQFTECTLNANEGTTVDLTANVTEGGDPLSHATVDYALDNDSFGELSHLVGVTDDGEHATALTVPERNGTVTAYAASGDGVDELALTVVDPPTGADPGPNPDPTLNWSVTDNTDVNGNDPRYSVSYNVSNVWSSFDQVEVEFRNSNNSGLTETISSSAARDTVEYSAEYGAGDTYNITIRALATNGSVLKERSVVDVADSFDPDGDDDLGGPNSPELAGRWITDASDQTDGAVYSAAYNVTNRDEFGRVEVEFRNLDDDSATRTVTLHQPRGRASYSPDYGNGQDYEIAFRVYDSDGLRVDDLTVSDVADGDEPEENVLLTNSTSPTLTNVDVSDVSESWDSRFEVAYEISDSSETFGSVEVEYKNLDTGETAETDVATATNGQVQLDAHQDNGDEFDITVRVYDESGAIVDVETVTDTGDGTDP